MRVVQAPEVYDKKDFEIVCFMGGGMGNTEWHEEFFKTLNLYNRSLLIVYNPYNPNITDVRKQIKWEFNYLNNYINDHFIFSMYLVNIELCPNLVFNFIVSELCNTDTLPNSYMEIGWSVYLSKYMENIKWSFI